jgi:hypothetical protein
VSVQTTEPAVAPAVLGELRDSVCDEPCLSPAVVAALEEVQYNRGFEDGMENMLDEIEGYAHSIERQEFEEMRRAAEIFFQQLIKVVPESGIVEHRLGRDTSTGNPATLTIISREHESKMSVIQELSSVCGLSLIRQFDYDCFFWVITDEKMDRWLINHDFPFVRTRTENVHV